MGMLVKSMSARFDDKAKTLELLRSNIDLEYYNKNMIDNKDFNNFRQLEQSKMI